jgi:bifunctional non-homologous end joining protein LigD
MNTQQLSHIELEFREGNSDKVYRAAIEAADNGFVVTFAYGRRGATLNTGTKTQQPVTFEEASRIYDKLVRSKTAKGYKPVGDSQSGTGIRMTVTDREQRDTGLRPQLLNPITEDEVAAYLDDGRWCAQEKFDGRRMLLRKSGTEIVAANRNGLCIGFPQAFAAQLAGKAGDFVIDGESVGDTFYAFDLLQNAAGDRRRLQYQDRLTALQAQFGELGGAIVVADTVCGRDKRKFLNELKSAGKEGVVFKDLNAAWTAGRPASGGCAMKCKFWATCSCVVAKVNARRSVALALGGSPVGNVTIPPNHEIPQIGQVVEVRYLYVADVGGSLYQPVYLGVRDDVCVADCTVAQQDIKYREPRDT